MLKVSPFISKGLTEQVPLAHMGYQTPWLITKIASDDELLGLRRQIANCPSLAWGRMALQLAMHSKKNDDKIMIEV